MGESPESLATEALKEYSKDAAGQLSEVIMQLTGKKMVISVPKTARVNIKEASNKVGGKSILTGYTAVFGNFVGSMIFLFAKGDALKLTEMALNEEINPTFFPSPKEKNVTREFYSLLADSYIGSFNKFLNASLEFKNPIIVMFGAFNLLNFLYNINESQEDYENRDIVWISIGYTIEGTEVKGEILTLIGPNILDRLKEEYKQDQGVEKNLLKRLGEKPLSLVKGTKLRSLKCKNLYTLEGKLKRDDFTGYLIVEVKDRLEQIGTGKILFISGDIIAASYEIGNKICSKNEALEEMFNIPYTNVDIFSYDATDIWLAIEKNKSQLFEYVPPKIKEFVKSESPGTKEAGEKTFSAIFEKEEVKLTREDLLNKFRIKELTEEDADSLIERVMDY